MFVTSNEVRIYFPIVRVTPKNSRCTRNDNISNTKQALELLMNQAEMQRAGPEYLRDTYIHTSH